MDDAGTTWDDLRRASKAIIAAAVPLAKVFIDIPDELQRGRDATVLRSPADNNRVHAYVLGAISAEPIERTIGGDHLETWVRIRFSAFLSAAGGTEAENSRKDFEKELRIVRRALWADRRSLGLVGVAAEGIREVKPLAIDQIYTDDYGATVLHVAEASLLVRLDEMI